MKTCLVAFYRAASPWLRCSPMRKARTKAIRWPELSPSKESPLTPSIWQVRIDYKISMRLGDTVYACRASAPAAVFIDWTAGKEFPAKLNGKVLLVKNPDGQVVELNIVGKKTPK